MWFTGPAGPLAMCLGRAHPHGTTHSLPAEEMGLRDTSPQRREQQGSASTAEGSAACRPMVSTQILDRETWVSKSRVRDKENGDKCLKSIAVDLVTLFFNKKLCKSHIRQNGIFSSMSTL